MLCGAMFVNFVGFYYTIMSFIFPNYSLISCQGSTDTTNTMIGWKSRQLKRHYPDPSLTYEHNRLPKWHVASYLYNQTDAPEFLIGGGYTLHKSMIPCLYYGMY